MLPGWRKPEEGGQTHMLSREEERDSRKARVRKRHKVQRINEETVTLGVVGNLCM